MADNYLERRMEDMKAGRLRPQVQTKSAAGPKKGFLEILFPSRRVLVVGGTHGLPLDIVRMFLKTGSKVAVMDTDKSAGESLAYREGIRYYNIDPQSPATFADAFANLLQAWRDIDIIIMASSHDMTSHLVESWIAHRDRYPVPFGYAGRLILLFDSPLGFATQEPANLSHSGSATCESNISEFILQLSSQLRQCRITANAIIKSSRPIRGNSPAPESRDPIRVIQTLVLPGNDFLSSLIIHCLKN